MTGALIWSCPLCGDDLDDDGWCGRCELHWPAAALPADWNGDDDD